MSDCGESVCCGLGRLVVLCRFKRPPISNAAANELPHAPQLHVNTHTRLSLFLTDRYTTRRVLTKWCAPQRWGGGRCCSSAGPKGALCVCKKCVHVAKTGGGDLCVFVSFAQRARRESKNAVLCLCTIKSTPHRTHNSPLLTLQHSKSILQRVQRVCGWIFPKFIKHKICVCTSVTAQDFQNTQGNKATSPHSSNCTTIKNKLQKSII